MMRDWMISKSTWMKTGFYNRKYWLLQHIWDRDIEESLLSNSTRCSQMHSRVGLIAGLMFCDGSRIKNMESPHTSKSPMETLQDKPLQICVLGLIRPACGIMALWDWHDLAPCDSWHTHMDAQRVVSIRGMILWYRSLMPNLLNSARSHRVFQNFVVPWKLHSTP
jgi:hypothetical protein